jgi:hypothetical protein
LALLALVAAATSAGAALSASNGPVVDGVVAACVHQNGGAIVASTAGCSGNDTALALLTDSGTAANSKLFDGLPPSSFIKSGILSEATPGWLQVDCSRPNPGGVLSSTYYGERDVQAAGFGVFAFACVSQTGGLFMEPHPDGTFFGGGTSSVPGDASHFVGSQFSRPSTGPVTRDLLTLYGADPPTAGFSGWLLQMLVQVRNSKDGSPTVTLQGTVVRTSEVGETARYDILYSLTES